MLDRFTHQDLIDLVAAQNDPAVSCYLSTYPTGREIYRPAQVLRQLVDTATEKLASHWMSRSDARQFLAPLSDLIDDKQVWQQTDRGMALFVGRNDFFTYRVGSSFEQQVFVSNQFFVRPIVPIANSYQKFFVLALSQNQVRLYEADQAEMKRLEVADLPQNLRDTMNVSSMDRGAQMHTGASEYAGKQASVFHGQRGLGETVKEDLKYYFRAVNHAVTSHLASNHQPLLLVCVADQVPIYQRVNQYPNLLPEFVPGNPEQLADHQLYAEGLRLIEEELTKSRQRAFQTYSDQINTSRTASETSTIAAAANRGQIDQLFFDQADRIEGSFNPLDQSVDYGPSADGFDRDLVEQTIANTLLHRGQIWSLGKNELPGEQPMAAVLRY